MALKHVLRPPSAVANVLDWKKASGGVATALSIDVHNDRIALALATLRSDKESSDGFVVVPWGIGRSRRRNSNHYYGQSHDLCGVHYSVLDSISLVDTETAGEQFSTSSLAGTTTDSSGRRRRRKRVVPPDARRKLAGVVRDHAVSGFVVSWPVQQDTGLVGASCGRTLWALEQFLDDDGDHYPPVFCPHRPLCLWNGARLHPKEGQDGDPLQTAKHSTADAFGRSSVYARISTKTEHRASKEQYPRDESVSVLEIGRDFFEHHWPATSTSMVHRHPGDDTRTTATRDDERKTRVGSRIPGSCVSSPKRTLIAA